MSKNSPSKRNLSDASYESPGFQSTKKKSSIQERIHKASASHGHSISDTKNVDSSLLEIREKELQLILAEVAQKEAERNSAIENWKQEIIELTSELGLDSDEYLNLIFSVSS